MTRRDAQGRSQAERLPQVLALRVAGMSQERVARHLGVAKDTVSRDCQLIDSSFLEAARQDLAVAKGQSLLRLEHLLLCVWPKCQQGDVASVRVVKELLGRDAPKQSQTINAQVAVAQRAPEAPTLVSQLSREQQDQLWEAFERMGVAVPAD